MIEKKFKLRFSGGDINDSVSYILVRDFNLMPSILQAKIDGSGGRMIISMKGKEKDIGNAVSHLRSIGVTVDPADDYVRMDRSRCIDCGSCISLCPTFAFAFDKKTWDVTLDVSRCVACGFCISACPTHAVTLKMNL